MVSAVAVGDGLERLEVADGSVDGRFRGETLGERTVAGRTAT
jgi:hypothetical protein